MRRLICTSIVLMASVGAYANGDIKGILTDAKEKSPLEGIEVKLLNADSTVRGTTFSEADGTFTFSDQEGNYLLQIQTPEYTEALSPVTIKEGQVANLAIELKELAKINQGQEVVISGKSDQSSVKTLYTAQKNNAAASDGISAEMIKKSPDRNTGEVLKRVSGTTIQDNKYVIVRGMNDRYNVAMADGAVLPSTEPNKKAFSFDIIPAAMVDNIVISKTATPENPGDFSGGLIQVQTKDIPDLNYTSLTFGTGYNTVSTFKNFQSGYRHTSDYLGFAGGNRSLPSSFPTSTEIQNGIAQSASNSSLSSLNNDYGIRDHKALPQMNFQLTSGKRWILKDGAKLGAALGISWNHNQLIKPDMLRQYDNYDYVDQNYTFHTDMGAMLNLGYSKGGSTITLKSLYNRILDDNFLYREGENYGGPNQVKYYAFDMLEKSLAKFSLAGNHKIGMADVFDWNATFNEVRNNQPDQRKVSYSKRDGSDAFYADNTTLGKANNRLFGKLKEQIVDVHLNYTHNFNFSIPTKVKIGFNEMYRNRTFSNRYIGAVLNSNIDDAEAIRVLPIQDLYSQSLINQGVYRLEDLTNGYDAYKAKVYNTAGYLMFDNDFTSKLRAVWGVRVENYNLKMTPGAGDKVDRNWVDVLPSVNLTYHLTEKTNLRAAYFRSVARPELREIAPVTYYDYELSALVNGNTNLQRSKIHNFDLKYEYFLGAGEIISASVFYKHFDQTLENRLYGNGSAYEIYPTNYPSASNIGAEIEIRKKLGFIADNAVFRNLDFYANFALIKSKVKLGEPTFINQYQIKDRPLSGQSPYAVNTSLTYSLPGQKFAFTALYNVVGKRIFLVGGDRYGNVYESPRNLIDLQASYSVSQKAQLKIGAKNLLNATSRYYFDQNVNGKFDGSAFKNGQIAADGDWLLQQYKQGISFTAAFTYNF